MPQFEALFISDLHLHADAPETAKSFFAFLDRHAAQTQKLFILGDLFEYWVGDDEMVLPFNHSVVEAIRKVSDAGTQVLWMAGNRDFLIEERFAKAAGLTILPDPSIVSIASRNIVLTHGDAQCIDDIDYMRFRKMVRTAEWREAFLAKSLQDRLVAVKVMRDQSRTAQQDKRAQIMDVNIDEILALFASSGTEMMIHGHTHRPAHHLSQIQGVKIERLVLPDWDFDGSNRRGGGIGIGAAGVIIDVPAEENVVLDQ